MESISNNTNQHLRLTRYIAGEMTKPEEYWFKAVIARNSEMKRLMNEMKKDWSITGEHLNQRSINPNKAWSDLYKRLDQENLVPNENSTTIKFAPQIYLKYAAIAIIALLISGVSGYKYFNPRQITLANNSNQNTIITTLTDGTTIYLAQNSTLTYPKRFAGKSRRVTLNGEAFFEVAKNAKKPFIIDTKAASVKVLGTSFNIKSTDAKNFELNVVEGKVGVNLNNNPSENIIAIAGDKVIANKEKLAKERTENIHTAKNKMVRLQFQDERFDNIINIINKTYGSNLELSGEKLKNKYISVTFENDISSIVNILSVSFNLELNHKPNGVTILSEKHE